MKKLIVFLLLAAILTLGFASCGKKKPAQTNDPGNDTAATTDRWEVLGPEIAAQYNADAKSFRFEMSAYSNSEKTSKNQKYIKGPDSLAGTQETIGQLVYERNSNANRLLGTTVEYIYWDQYGWEKQAPQIKLLVDANQPDAPDLFVNMIFDLGNATLQGCFKDVKSLPGSYFDFSANGWMKDWMESMSLTGDRAYILAGDYFIDVLRAFGVLPFNADLMNENGDNLAEALFGKENGLSEGETMSQRFFDYVEDGKWTWDSLKKLCEAIYVDSDGDGQNSIEDTLGILGDASTGMTTALYLYSSGEPLFETYTKEDGKQWIRYPDGVGALGDIFDAVASVYGGKGALATKADSEKEGTPDNPNTAYHWVKFGQGETLFAGACVLGALEDTAFQQMEALWSVVPIPKVSADKQYNTIIHNVGDAGAMNVNTDPAKAKMLSAYLQFCTEHSAEIKNEFLQITTKYKTTIYNQGTDRMLNLIYANVLNGRDKAIEDLMRLNENCKQKVWHNLMKEGNRLNHTSADLVTGYASARDAKQAHLDTILETWYGLPKAGE